MNGREWMRWEHCLQMDAWCDRRRIYPPISALEMWGAKRVYQFDVRMDAATLDATLTKLARKRPLRYRPWKIAR